MKWVSRTHVGNVRPTNQDMIIIGQSLYGVADGMGGHLAGGIASRMTGELLCAALSGLEPRTDTLAQCISDVNAKVYERQKSDETLHGMGTTLTVLWEGGESVYLAHIGDSRAYLIRNGKMEQVTSDHSMVADMVRKGVLTEEQAACHPMRNYITRAVGTEEDIEADLYILPRKKGDRWLVCSDGLHGYVSEEHIMGIVMNHDMDPTLRGRKLLKAALDAGGYDNITIVLIDLEGEGSL